MVMMRFAIRALGLVSVFILARLLSPGDFGLITLAGSIILAVEVLGQFSFEMMLIQDQTAARSSYDTAWTLNLLRAVVTALLVAGVAGQAAVFFAEPRLELVIYAFAALTALEGLQNIGIVDFRKELNFRRDFNFMVSQKVVSFIVTLAAALYSPNYWALVGGIAAGRIAGIVMSYTMHPFRPRLCMTHWRPLVGFSKWLLFNNLLGFVASKLDVFIIGRMFGAHQLGIYNLAQEIGALPSTELSFPIQRAVFPAFSKLSGEPERLRRTYIDGLAVLLLLATPASVGIAVLAEPFIVLTMGDKWREAIPIVQILCLFGMIRLFGANAGSILLAVGRPHLLTKRTMIYVLAMGPLLVGGIMLDGLEGAAWGLVVASIINLVTTLQVTLPVIGVTVSDLASAIWRIVLASALMAVAVLGVLAYGIGPASLLTQLVAGVLVGVVGFVVADLLLWQLCGRPAGAERIALMAISEVITRCRGALGVRSSVGT